MKREAFMLNLEYPEWMTKDEVIQAIYDTIHLGRSKLAGATKDEVAQRFLNLKFCNVIDSEHTLYELFQ